MSPRTKPKPIIDEDTMAALEDYFYRCFLAKLDEKNIDTGGLKRLADRCATDPLRAVPAKKAVSPGRNHRSRNQLRRSLDPQDLGRVLTRVTPSRLKLQARLGFSGA